MRIEFIVYGVPQTAGSKRGFVVPRKGADHSTSRGYRSIITDDNAKGKPWRADIQQAALKAMRSTNFEQGFAYEALLTGPLLLQVYLQFPRPKSHYRTGKYAGQLRATSPSWHDKKPDATKCLRFIEDALTHIVWNDDAQVAKQIVTKSYTSEAPFTRIIVEELT